MRFSTLALCSALIAAAVSAHTSPVGSVASSSSSLLLSRDAPAQPASANIVNITKRGEEVDIEEVDIQEGDDDEEQGGLQARAKKHHKKHTHHRSTKHSGHKKHQKSHTVHATADIATGRMFNGKGTFFKPDQGACGAWNVPSDHIVALSSDIYQDGEHCFDSIEVCHNGKCVPAKVADECPGCHHTSLDMTSSLFKELANLDIGVIDIKWRFT